jgi:uncharacterized HAD superfamily protein
MRLNMNEENKFEKYLLSEYSNIAQAHFKSIETISTFFRYYLLIMSIPISAIAVFFQIAPDKKEISSIVLQYKLPISIVLFCISLVGLGVFCYITNLRMDTILYAKTVNGIRKYFYDRSDIDIGLKLQMRVLPQSPQLPPYCEKSYFLPVVFVFGIMNTLYLSIGCYMIIKSYPVLVGVTTIFFLCHFPIYYWYAYHRETAYFKSNILGIDIDGVLNKHRERFCSLLNKKTGKRVKPEDITVIPVHEHPTLGITREDERKVFNDPEYWVGMDVIEDAAESIRKLQNMFRLKIYIFTYRPWPDNPNKTELIEDIKKFLHDCKCFSFNNFLLKITIYIPFVMKFSFLFKEQPLKQMTKEWLERYGFKFDKFIFEKGNDYSSDPRGEFNNRFYVSRMKKIRFFVEDDLEKAKKLSYICDIVFLFDQPYNRERTGIPTNIIPVNSWNEIYKKIRKFS